MSTLKFLSLEVSSHCQLNCEMCARKIMTRKPGNMSLETAILASQEFGKFKRYLDCAVFNCWGEPTLNPDLLGIMSLFVHRRVKTVISTNCMKYMDGITESGVNELILHLDEVEGPRKENALKYILNPGQLKILYIQMMVTPSTQRRAEEFVETYRKYTENSDVIKVFLKYPIVDGLADQHSYLRGDLRNLVDYYFENGKRKPGKMRKILVAGTPFMPRNKFCTGLKGGVTVLHDGTLVLECCQVNKEMRIGHVRNGIMKNFNGPLATRWRENFPNEGPCKACKELVIKRGER